MKADDGMRHVAGPTEFAAISNGSIDVAAARKLVAEAIRRGDRTLDYICAALRDTTFRLVASVPRATGIPQWHDLMTNAAALARQEGHVEVSAKIAGFAEIVAQAAKFQERHPIDEVPSRPVTRQVLSAISGGKAPRTVPSVATETGIAEINLARLLVIMEIHGLVSRKPDGACCLVEITPAGHKHLKEMPEAGRGCGQASLGPPDSC